MTQIVPDLDSSTSSKASAGSRRPSNAAFVHRLPTIQDQEGNTTRRSFLNMLPTSPLVAGTPTPSFRKQHAPQAPGKVSPARRNSGVVAVRRGSMAGPHGFHPQRVTPDPASVSHPHGGGPAKAHIPIVGSIPRQQLTPRLVILVLLVAINRKIQAHISHERMLVLEALQLLYVGFCVPFRLGLLYDPHHAAETISSATMYCLWAIDLAMNVVALFSALETLRDSMISAPVASLAPMDMNFSSDTDRRNSAFMNKLVKLSSTRQETMRRGSVFLAKETSMKPQFLLSSSWDKKEDIGAIHISLDWISLLPFDWFYVGNAHAMILCQLPKLLRMHKAPNVARLIKHSLAEHEYLAGFHNIGMSLLVGVIVLGLVLIHWAACFVLLVEHLQCGYTLDQTVDEVTCWARDANLQGASLFRTYVYTMVVVGYGFLVPRTNVERVVVVGVQFMRFCIAGGIIGAYVFLFECQNRQVNEFHDQVDGVKEYLTARRLSKHIQAKVLDFYEHFWTAQRGIDEDTIIATLPSHIQTQCFHALRIKLLKNVPIFRNQPANVVKRLISKMKRQCYGRLDWVARDGTCKAVYMVCRGKIAILNINEIVLNNVTDGQCFGMSSLLPGGKELHSARAETYCDVYTLDRQTIEDVVLHHAALGEITWHAMLSEVHSTLQKASANFKMVHGLTFVDRHKEQWSYPNSAFRRRWEIAVVLVLVVFAIDIPVHIAFDAPRGWLVFAARVLLDLFLLADFGLRARYFGYMHNDTLVVNSWFIWREYVDHGGMLLDGISNIPFALIADCLPAATHPSLRLALQVGEWCRFLRMRKLLSLLSNVLKQFQVNNTTYIIVSLFICVPFACHIGGCIWYWIAALSKSASDPTAWSPDTLTVDACLAFARDYQNCTWLLFDHVHFGASSDYVRAFYWSVVSLVTVQFGSILPFTDAECVYMFVWLFLSSMANYGALGALANAVTRINWATSAKQMQVAVAHRFMASEHVSKNVRHDVSNYYKHHWTQSTEHQVMRVLKPLPDNLRQEIQSFLHETSVGHLTLFKPVQRADLLYIYSIMKHQSYKRAEFIVRAGDACDIIYILTRGTMEALLPVNDLMVPIQLLHPGDCIGESAFVQKRSHDTSVRVVTESSDVSVLSRDEFATIEMHFRHLWPKIEAIAQHMADDDAALLRPFEANLRKANIYRTLHQSPTIYIEPRLEDHLIRHGSTLYRVWELLVAIVVIYNLIQIPFRIALDPDPSDQAMLAFSAIDLVCDAIFLVDMYIKYNHLIITDKNGDEVVSIPLIRANYWHGALKIDALSSVPIYYVGTYRVMTLCRLPRLLRCYQIPDLLHSFHTFVQEQTSSATVSEGLEFIKLLLGLVLASHLAATGLFLISHSEGSHDAAAPPTGAHGEIWYEVDAVIEEHHGDMATIYLRAFYWGLGVLSSFDYMDIEVSKVGETIWFCAVALTGVLFIGVVIGQVSTAIFNANKELREVEMQLDNFAFYARMKQLPPFLTRRAKLFFQFQLDCNMGMDAHVIFCDLPQSLRLELFKDLYTKLLAPIPLFSSLSRGQLHTIAEKLRTALYLPGDNIIVEGDVGATLYIMKQGLGEKYSRSCHLIMAPLYEGSVFGELGFFLSMRYAYCVRAVKCCEILCLAKADWINAWSPDVRMKLETKMAREVQNELDLLQRSFRALKQNFGISRPAPLKLTMMLQSSSSAGVPMTSADVSGRNFYEYLRHTAPAKNKQNVLLLAPMKEFSIWSFGDPPSATWAPDSVFRTVWDLLMLGVVSYYALVLPFRASFVFVPPDRPLWIVVWFTWDYLLDGLCAADTFFRWQVFHVFTAGDMQTARSVLRRHYEIHGRFYSDLVSLLPIELFVYAFPHTSGWQTASLWRLNRMVRLGHLPHLVSTLHKLLCHRTWFQPYRLAFQYVTAFVAPFFLVAHWIACVWFFVSFVARADDAAAPSWLATHGFGNVTATTAKTTAAVPLGFSDATAFTSLNVYLASLYYAASSLTSQSFGDVVCLNVVETWLTIAIMVFAIAFYGVLVGVLSEMVQDKLNPRASFEQHMVDISTFFNYRHLPFQFFIQTSRFARTQWQDRLGRTEDDFLSVLSTTIREDIAMYVKQNVVKNLSFLNQCQEVFVRALVTKLHTEEYIVSDIIFQLGDVGRVLYFIDVGHITLVASKKASKQCNTWNFFGGTSLFADHGREATAVANVNCTMFLLYYDDFKRLVERFPEYYSHCRSEWDVSDAAQIEGSSLTASSAATAMHNGR
ncbi:Aste57867_22013 [Aphanomyces stellatus]|uniref:Aste57867_22013 protein n=1 Tax=Aphanomyces stellatus TaxID=120398 RepID=A0A485LJ44_9STRA|nr:hypothetical protein As57867_021944 [Aphanomyces stellatus]VFT98681.1 Aste57867_22013 [Aphanomyces stellatus]